MQEIPRNCFRFLVAFFFYYLLYLNIVLQIYIPQTNIQFLFQEVIILSFCLLVVVALTTAEEDLTKSMKNVKPAGDMDMMETAETKYKGSKGGGGGGGHYRGGGGGHYRGGGGGGGKGGGYKGGKGFKKG